MQEKNISEIDFVEVVRCKDCRKSCYNAICGCYFCNENKVKPNDFCSYGERRKNGRHKTS